MRPAHLDPSAPHASAWAAQMPDGSVRLVLINKDPQLPLRFSLASETPARLWRLQAPGLEATSGVTLAGAGIQPGKAWQPLHEDTLASQQGEVQLELQPASAAALFFPGAP